MRVFILRLLVLILCTHLIGNAQGDTQSELMRQLRSSFADAVVDFTCDGEKAGSRLQQGLHIDDYKDGILKLTMTSHKSFTAFRNYAYWSDSELHITLDLRNFGVDGFNVSSDNACERKDLMPSVKANKTISVLALSTPGAKKIAVQDHFIGPSTLDFRTGKESPGKDVTSSEFLMEEVDIVFEQEFYAKETARVLREMVISLKKPSEKAKEREKSDQIQAKYNDDEARTEEKMGDGQMTDAMDFQYSLSRNLVAPDNRDYGIRFVENHCRSAKAFWQRALKKAADPKLSTRLRAKLSGGAGITCTVGLQEPCTSNGTNEDISINTKGSLRVPLIECSAPSAPAN